MISISLPNTRPTVFLSDSFIILKGVISDKKISVQQIRGLGTRLDNDGTEFTFLAVCV